MKRPAITRWPKIAELITNREHVAVQDRVNQRQLISDDLLIFVVQNFAFIVIQLLNAEVENLINAGFPIGSRGLLMRIPHVKLP